MSDEFKWWFSISGTILTTVVIVFSACMWHNYQMTPAERKIKAYKECMDLENPLSTQAIEICQRLSQ